MNAPSPYRIWQRVPADRQNARRATIEAARSLYAFKGDDLLGEPAAGFKLPDYLAKLPAEAQFVPQKKFELLRHKLAGQLNAKLVLNRVRHVDDYAKMFPVLPQPHAFERWSRDEEFGRQRLAGVNPMMIRALHQSPPPALAEAADLVLRQSGSSLRAALDRGAVFETDYAMLREDCIQRHVTRRRRHLAAPRCLFVVGDDSVLRPVAIQLWPHDHPGDNPAYTTLDDESAWRLARWHAQCADAAVHEGIFHLFETHLVSEVLAVALLRNVHPDHPVSQLLREHFEANLAIDDLARSDMLTAGKAIDMAMSAGAAGSLNAMRLWFNDGWSWEKRNLARDLEARGVDDEGRLPRYHYRDDALKVRDILGDYARNVMSAFYLSDEDVRLDDELRAWCAQCAAQLPGFPSPVATRDELFALLADVIFRASAQHAAVNNGQYDVYGCILAAPGALFTAPPTRKSYTDAELVAALPHGDDAFAQLTLAWVLSEPTHYGLLGLGHAPAFADERSHHARQAVAATRRSLAQFMDAVVARNAQLEAQGDVAYTYLDPRNIESSTGT